MRRIINSNLLNGNVLRSAVNLEKSSMSNRKSLKKYELLACELTLLGCILINSKQTFLYVSFLKNFVYFLCGYEKTRKYTENFPPLDSVLVDAYLKLFLRC